VRCATRWIGLVLVATGCVSSREQSALDPTGPHARSILTEFDVMLLVAVAVYVIVIGAIPFVARRAKSGNEDDETREQRARRVVTGCVIGSAIILVSLITWDIIQARTLEREPDAPPITIVLTGRQWWWDVEYVDSIANRRVRLANEIHLPVGRDIRIVLETRDVIHSLWIPNLQGKKDLIPGHPATLTLRADRPGRYRAQCAEFCGLQHAKMALPVVAEPEPQFAAWLERYRDQAPSPSDTMAQLGQRVFEQGTCAACHAVAGSSASGRVGPDLSHIGSRLTLAAGTLENTRDNLVRWIADPQQVKPGAQMPPSALPSRELMAIVAWLESRK